MTMEMVVFVILNLAEEMSGFNPRLPERRKREIQSELLRVIEPIMKFLQTNCGAMLENWRKTNSPTARAVAETILRTIHAFAERLDPKYMFETGFLRVLCQLLSTDLAVTACEVLGGALAKETDRILESQQTYGLGRHARHSDTPASLRQPQCACD
jgi:hypothetical protein